MGTKVPVTTVSLGGLFASAHWTNRPGGKQARGQISNGQGENQPFVSLVLCLYRSWVKHDI